MITLGFIVIISLLTIILLPYSIGYLIAIFTPVRNKKADHTSLSPTNDSLAILVPSHHEGTGLIDCLHSLLEQTYTENICVHVLIQDTSDSSYIHLQTFFQLHNNGDTYTKNNKEIVLHVTGKQGKREKINIVLPTLSETYIGFLDADHRAENQWVSTSIHMLTSNDYIGVQSIRRPLSVRNFFQVYDSLQNHLGNEVLNNMYATLGYSTFFTGTTCIFKRTEDTPLVLDDCQTEDTYLSYKLITKGFYIGYNGTHGSYEEVAPNYSSYFNRRRRWSHGHTKTMKDFFASIRSTSYSLGQKLFLSLHSFYYMSGCVLLSSFIILGLWYILQFPLWEKCAIIISSIVCARYIGYQHNTKNIRLIDICIAYLNIFPWVTLLAIWIARFFDPELFHTLISFPYEKYIFILGGAALIIAYLPVVKGSLDYRRPTFGQVLLHGLAYPIILLIDIYAISCGMADLCIGRKKWDKIKRSGTIDQDVQNIIPSISATLVKKQHIGKICITGLFIILLGITIHDMFPKNSCGEKTYLFGRHIIYNKSFDINHTLQTTKQRIDDSSFALVVDADITVHNNVKQKNDPISLTYSIDNKTIHTQKIDNYTGSISFQHSLPMGWERKTLQVDITTKHFSCTQQHQFTTVLKETTGNSFSINNEPFYIKGIIPSFSHSYVHEELAYKDIKHAGANAVRLYHNPGNSVLGILEDLEMLVMSQPNNSTRSNIDITKSSDRGKLVQRYMALSKEMEGFPYSLFVSLGNELELPTTNIKEKIADITSVLEEVKQKNISLSPLVYATYMTYIDYPVDITTINMLDTGLTYWKKAIELLESRGKTIFASEFGGFTAGSEKELPTTVRIHRMYTHADMLSAVGSIGLMFFQSHDNWGQPLVQGYNDPFTPNHPDDIRGYRTREHIPKPELHHLKNIFADIEFSSSTNGTLQITNRRNYTLSELQVTIMSGGLATEIIIGTLEPGDIYTSSIKAQDTTYTYNAIYSTHKGLKHEVKHTFNPIAGTGSELSPLKEIYLNTWYIVGNSNEWKPFVYKDIPVGDILMRIDLPTEIHASDLLLLSGLGASSASISQEGNDQIHNIGVTQPYRDIIIPLKDLNQKFDLENPLEIKFQRRYTIYTSKQFVPRNEDIVIDVEQPLIYRKK